MKRLGDFRPISILNVDNLLGNLANRTVYHLQRIWYIDESIQKAGVSGISGCIEHAAFSRDITQEAKKKRTDLSIVWLDLANTYELVLHELLFKALDFFHLPERIKKMIMSYHNKFNMRFTTEDFTSDWHRLEVGIGAGCTIAVIWFLFVVEMILRSANCSEERAKIRSPKKAFMEDVTLLTQNQHEMRKILARLLGPESDSRQRNLAV